MKIWDDPRLGDGIGVHVFQDPDGWKEARAYLASLGFLSGERRKLTLNQIHRHTIERRKKDRIDEARKRAVARQLWRQSIAIAGTLAETYLRGRDITGHLPSTLQFLPECSFYLASGGSPFYPAMIAKIQSYGDNTPAIQVTYLDEHGNKHPSAVAAGAARKSLGKITGGAIRLGNKTETVHAIAEGLESALSFSDHFGVRCDAVLSANGMSKWIPPDGLKVLGIAHDNDTNQVGRRAAQALANRIIPMGIEVRMCPAPDGFNDWNDFENRDIKNRENK